MSKPLVCVYMGQGAVVSLTAYNLYSAEFSSCCPLIMFNQSTKMAGYYHVPGKTDVEGHSAMRTLNEDDFGVVDAIARKVEPTKVWILPGLWVGSVVDARLPMRAAFNARQIASLTDMRIFPAMTNEEMKINRLKMPARRGRGSHGVTLSDDGKIKISPSRPPFAMDKWFDSKRDRQKRPSEEDGVFFWGWDTPVSDAFSILTL